MDYDQFMSIIGTAATEKCVLAIMFGSGYKFIYKTSDPFSVARHVDQGLNCVKQYVQDIKGKEVVIYGAITDITHVYIATEPDKGTVDVGSILR